MNDTSKISFIPKGSLAREETFLERPRPRSLLGFFATFVFLASIGSYVGLYFYNNILADRINGLALQVQNIQKDFEQPEIAQARVFRARAELVQKLLNEHIVVTPIFDFLATNTAESIFYHDLKFTRGEKGTLSLEVSGEAPSYTSLAYQADVFRQKDEELFGFSVDNIMLTKTGSVSFVFNMTFASQYLSYVKLHTVTNDTEPISGDVPSLPAISAEPSKDASGLPGGGSAVSQSDATTSAPLSDGSGATASFETQCEEPLVSKVLDDGSTVCVGQEPSEAKDSPVSFWSWFKFW